MPVRLTCFTFRLICSKLIKIPERRHLMSFWCNIQHINLMFLLMILNMHLVVREMPGLCETVWERLQVSLLILPNSSELISFSTFFLFQFFLVFYFHKLHFNFSGSFYFCFLSSIFLFFFFF